MQTLVSEVVSTFAGDAEALLRGFGRIVVDAVMAPVERMATACDVAGVLSGPRLASHRQTGHPQRAHASGSRRSPGARRRRGPFGCLGALGELT